MNKALFLDRDGIINVEKNFVHKQEDFEFVEGIFDLVSLANSLEYLVIVVTNQAGIGRGYYTEADFHQLMDWVKGKFLENKARLDHIYFCPYHAEFGVGEYRQASKNRKPEPGMFFQAAGELNIDLTKSIMVGDRISDMQAAHAASIPWRFHLGEQGSPKLGIQIRGLDEVIDFMRTHEMSKI